MARNLITWLNSLLHVEALIKQPRAIKSLKSGQIVSLKMALDNEQYLRQLQREYLDFLDDDVSEFAFFFDKIARVVQLSERASLAHVERI